MQTVDLELRLRGDAGLALFVGAPWLLGVTPATGRSWPEETLRKALARFVA